MWKYNLNNFGFSEFVLPHSKELGKEIHDLLGTYIKQHQALLCCCDKVEEFFWPLIFMKTAISMFYHIFITFAMITVITNQWHYFRIKKHSILFSVKHQYFTGYNTCAIWDLRIDGNFYICHGRSNPLDQGAKPQHNWG